MVLGPIEVLPREYWGCEWQTRVLSARADSDYEDDVGLGSELYDRNLRVRDRLSAFIEVRMYLPTRAHHNREVANPLVGAWRQITTGVTLEGDSAAVRNPLKTRTLCSAADKAKAETAAATEKLNKHAVPGRHSPRVDAGRDDDDDDVNVDICVGTVGRSNTGTDVTTDA